VSDSEIKDRSRKNERLVFVTESIRILHIDDDWSFAEMVATFLEREDDRFTVKTATSADEGYTPGHEPGTAIAR
jgi:hypothetical protein